MPTDYHRNLQQIIETIGRQFPTRFVRVYNDKRPIHITHPTKNESLLYFPDVRFETKTGKVYIFEIMEREAETQALIVAHVLETMLTPQILKVFFVVQSQKHQGTVERITRIVLARLSDMGATRMNKNVRFYHVVINRSDASSIERVQKILAETGQIPLNRA